MISLSRVGWDIETGQVISSIFGVRKFGELKANVGSKEFANQELI